MNEMILKKPFHSTKTTEPADPRYLESIRLFNKGEYFESHEVLEKLWIETPQSDPIRNFYKGFIQCAAALYLLKRGTATGAKALCETSTQYLAAYGPKCLGLDVARLIADMKTCFHSDPKAPNLPTAYFC